MKRTYQPSKYFKRKGWEAFDYGRRNVWTEVNDTRTKSTSLTIATITTSTTSEKVKSTWWIIIWPIQQKKTHNG